MGGDVWKGSLPEEASPGVPEPNLDPGPQASSKVPVLPGLMDFRRQRKCQAWGGSVLCPGSPGTPCTNVLCIRELAFTVCLRMCMSLCVCPSVCLGVRGCPCVCAPAQACVLFVHNKAILSQRRQLSPKGEGSFPAGRALWPTCPSVHTHRGHVSCPRSHGTDSMSFCRKFI